ncbi:hypothetical protein [Streptomyces variegatus]|uniref:hypothetical protein n=1 Tax=Streptomyces variegatus TaxID=284040 RepID=UPI003C2F1BAA
MPRTLLMPSEDELPDGPRRKFVEELHLYFRAAGRPDLTRILAVIDADRADPHGDLPEGPGPISRETVRRLLKGKTNSTWKKVELVFEALCRIANRDPEADRWADTYDVDEKQSQRAWLCELWSNSVDEVRISAAPLPAPRIENPAAAQNQGGWGRLPSGGYSDEPPF